MQRQRVWISCGVSGFLGWSFGRRSCCFIKSNSDPDPFPTSSLWQHLLGWFWNRNNATLVCYIAIFILCISGYSGYLYVFNIVYVHKMVFCRNGKEAGNDAMWLKVNRRNSKRARAPRGRNSNGRQEKLIREASCTLIAKCIFSLFFSFSFDYAVIRWNPNGARCYSLLGAYLFISFISYRFLRTMCDGWWFAWSPQLRCLCRWLTVTSAKTTIRQLTWCLRYGETLGHDKYTFCVYSFNDPPLQPAKSKRQYSKSISHIDI